MKNILVFMWVLWAFSCKGSDAQEAQKPTLRPTSAIKKAKVKLPAEDPVSAPFLWEVSHPKGTSYLVGSLHVLVDAEGVLNDALYDKLAESRNVLFEADVRELKSNPTFFVKRMKLPPGKSLQKMLTRKQWNSLKKLVPGIPVEILDITQPWAIVSAISRRAAARLGGESKRSMDESLLRFAELQYREISFLESIDESINALEGALSVGVLKEVLDEPDDVDIELKAVRKLYLAGDEKALVSLLIKHDSPVQKEMNDLLFFERNKKWVKKLVPILEQGNTFVVVGSGHLIGEKSVVSMLRKKGMKVDRVPMLRKKQGIK